MKGRDGSSKTNIDQHEPPGAFVGAEASDPITGEPARKSRGPQRVKPTSFMAEGESQATSIKAARMPTHWRRGGFVQRKAEGGDVGPSEAQKAREAAARTMRSRRDMPDAFPVGGMRTVDEEQRPKTGPTPRPDRDADTNYKRGGHLSAGQRKALPSSSFALPGQGKGPQGKGSGSYPIPDASHARNALARVSQHGNPSQQAKVRAAVHRKFPGIGKK